MKHITIALFAILLVMTAVYAYFNKRESDWD